jgi:hypothetical protein
LYFRDPNNQPGCFENSSLVELEKLPTTVIGYARFWFVFSRDEDSLSSTSPYAHGLCGLPHSRPPHVSHCCLEALAARAHSLQSASHGRSRRAPICALVASIGVVLLPRRKMSFFIFASLFDF